MLQGFTSMVSMWKDRKIGFHTVPGLSYYVWDWPKKANWLHLTLAQSCPSPLKSAALAEKLYWRRSFSPSA